MQWEQSVTQTQNDPWAAAGAAPASEGGNSETGGSGLLPPAAAPGMGGGALFGGGGKSLPSLFNKTHFAGTERTGIITDIKDVHSRELIKGDDGKFSSGGLKYWEDGNSGKGVRPVTYPVSKVTGKQNRPVMDTHFLLATEYRMTEQEAGAVQRSADFANEDDGGRAFVVPLGSPPMRAAIEAYNASPEGKADPIAKPEDLLTKRLTAKRLANPGEKRNEIIRITAA